MSAIQTAQATNLATVEVEVYVYKTDVSFPYGPYTLPLLSDGDRIQAGWDGTGPWTPEIPRYETGLAYKVHPRHPDAPAGGQDYPYARIRRLKIYSRQDGPSMVEPDGTTRFTRFGVVDFDVLYQEEGAPGWKSISVFGNDLVKRTIEFPTLSIGEIQVLVFKTADDNNGPIVEFEAEMEESTPEARGVSILDGPVEVGVPLTGSYTYFSQNNDPELKPALFQWYLADDASGTNAAAVVGATQQSYTPKGGDQGKYIIFEVTVRSTSASLNTGAPVRAVTRSVVAGHAPEARNVMVSGTPMVGQVMAGTFDYVDIDLDPAGSHIYRWYRADDVAGLLNRVLVSEGSSTYPVQMADQGKFLVFEVTPKSAIGTPDAGAPVSAVSAEFAFGRAPVASDITFTGEPPKSKVALQSKFKYEDADLDPEGAHLYRWFRCDDLTGANAVEITGETQSFYIPSHADLGKYLMVEITPVSARGVPSTGAPVRKVTATSVTGTAPSATEVAITGNFTVGQTLTGSFKFYDLDDDLEDVSGRKVSWYVSDSASGNPVLVPEANNQMTFTLRPQDAGNNRTVLFSVDQVKSMTGLPSVGTRPSNPAGAWQATRTGLVVGGTAPVAAGLGIEGSPTVGSVLEAKFTYSDVENDPPGVHLYQWFRCDDTAGANPVAISGATQATYTVQGADQAKYLMVEVRPRAASGIPPDTGAPVRYIMPTFITGTAPRVSNVQFTGNLIVGETLAGTYTYEDPDNDREGATEYQWYFAEAGGRGPYPIPGATQRTYVLQGEYQSCARIYFSVEKVKSLTGVPNERVGPWIVSREGPVRGRAPTVSKLAIEGTPAFGVTLKGSFTYEDLDNDPPGTHQYAWFQSSDAAGLARRTVGGGSDSYTVQGGDEGKYIVFEVTPVATRGDPKVGEARSVVSTTPVQGLKPSAEKLRIGGYYPEYGETPSYGTTLSASFDYKHPTNLGPGQQIYQWFRWKVLTPGGSPVRVLIAGATSSSYLVTYADQGEILGVEATPVSVMGTRGDPVSLILPVEVKYKTTGTWTLPSSGGGYNSVPISITNRVGNAPARLRVKYTATAGPYIEAVNFWLVGPGPNVYREYKLPQMKPGLNPTTGEGIVDVSMDLGNGVWQLRANTVPASPAAGPWAQITQLTLEFLF